MKADGLDISNHTSNHIDEYQHINFDFIITVCDSAQERCPLFVTNAKRLHYNFKDPAKAKGHHEEIVKEFEIVRNQIKKYCLEFVSEYL